MTVEIAILAASCVFVLLHIFLASHAASLQRGYRWTAGARDIPVPPLTGVAGRLERALANLIETFPVFAAAVLLVHALEREGSFSFWGSILYFGARLLYLPVYAAGIFLVRSLIWNVAVIGIVLVLLSLSFS